MYFLVLTTVCITCKNTHSNSFLSFPPPTNNSKSCGQLTSTTWVWIYGQQRTSTPSRRFSRFTTRPVLSSHRHICVSPASVFLSLSGSHFLWLDECLFFFFPFSWTQTKDVWVESAASLTPTETGNQNKSLWTPTLLRESSGSLFFCKVKQQKFLLFLNLKGIKITFHYKWIAGSKRMFVFSTMLLLGVHTLLIYRWAQTLHRNIFL